LPKKADIGLGKRGKNQSASFGNQQYLSFGPPYGLASSLWLAPTGWASWDHLRMILAKWFRDFEWYGRFWHYLYPGG